MHFRDDEEWGGPDGLPVCGLGPAAVSLARGLDIRLNRPVLRVDYTPAARGSLPSSAAVAATVMAAGGEAYSARYVIVTLPLGCLQAHGGPSGTLFEPPLPPVKLDAVMTMGNGLLNKVGG